MVWYSLLCAFCLSLKESLSTRNFDYSVILVILPFFEFVPIPGFQISYSIIVYWHVCIFLFSLYFQVCGKCVAVHVIYPGALSCYPCGLLCMNVAYQSTGCDRPGEEYHGFYYLQQRLDLYRLSKSNIPAHTSESSKNMRQKKRRRRKRRRRKKKEKKRKKKNPKYENVLCEKYCGNIICRMKSVHEIVRWHNSNYDDGERRKQICKNW